MASFSAATYGYVNTGSSAGYAEILENYARAYTDNPVALNMWGVNFRGRVGAIPTETDPTFRFAVWEATSSYIPNTLSAYSEEETATTDMTGGGSGAVLTSPVESTSNGSPTATSVMMWSGKSYSLGIQPDDNDIRVAMIFAASLSGKYTKDLYQRQSSTDSTTPPSTFGSYFTSSNEGHFTIWVEGYLNEAPRVPVDRSPSGTIASPAPTFSSTFRDRNGAWGTDNSGYDSGDKLKRYRIQVRRASDLVSMWAPAAFSATTDESNGNYTSKVYAGSTLILGTEYEWRIQHQDQFEEWGDWSSWLSFTPAQAGYVFTNASDPTGKQEVITGITFGGSWTHQGSASTNAVQIRLKEGGTVVQTSGTISKTVASSASPGTDFTISWADTGFDDLDWGHSYTYEIRAKDTSEVWSDWSDGRAFNTNAIPATPSNLTPSTGATSTSYPLLRCNASDADADDTGANLTVKAIITRPNATTTTVTLSYVSGAYQYQTTGTEISATGTYSWVAYSYDGTVYSGGVTSEGSAETSSVGTFVYATGPTVTIDSPTEEEAVESISPTIMWTVTGGTQVKYRILITDATTMETVLDTGLVSDTVDEYEVPLGYLVNGTDYTLVVEIEDNLALVGLSSERAFSVDYPPVPALTNFQANPMLITTDPVPSAIRLSWDASIEPAPWFVRYIVRRNDLVKPLAYISNQTTTEFIDYFPVSGQSYTYTIRQVNVIDSQNLASPTVAAEAQVDLDGVVICSLTSPGEYRSVLSFGEDRKHSLKNNDAIYLPWGATKPTTVQGIVRYWTTSATYHLINDVRIGVTALQRLEELEELVENGGVLCYRDERGRKRFVVFERDGLVVADKFPQQSDVTLSLREEAYEEGEDS